jgi:hypothetical protein
MSKCAKDAENFYSPLVMVAIWGQKMTLPNKTVYQNGSIDASFDPPLFSLDITFNVRILFHNLEKLSGVLCNNTLLWDADMVSSAVLG